MKLIITGATGFIGRNLAEGFHTAGHEVLATGRSLAVGAELEQAGIDFKPADITNQNDLIGALSNADCLIHCAAKAGDWGKYSEFHKSNVVGTRNVLTACSQHRIGKMIFISSPSVYFNGVDRFDIREDEPLPDPLLGHYARTKRISECELLDSAQKDIEVIILRPRAVYGPHDNTILPRILQMSKKRSFPLINNGQALVDVTWIDNLCLAIKQCITADDGVWGQVYNITNGDPLIIRDWFAFILETFDRPFKPRNIPVPAADAIAGLMEFLSALPFGPSRPSMTRFSVGYMTRSMTLSLEKAGSRLGYKPEINTRESFMQYKVRHKSSTM